nr:hypothetical protein [Tanacetum cinerariifolium]
INILPCNQQHHIETELALCDKKIQAIMNGESSLQQASALKLPRVTSNRFFTGSFMLQWHFLTLNLQEEFLVGSTPLLSNILALFFTGWVNPTAFIHPSS